MKYISKSKDPKTTQMVMNDMKYAFDILIHQKRFLTSNNTFYAITITHTLAKHEKDLNFILNNNLFNKINSEYRHSKEHLNYLYVIEYPEKVSKGIELPDNSNIHTHIVINTSIPLKTIEYYIQNAFRKLNLYVENITKRNDKENYINYLIKQGKENNYLTNDSYNYKILYN